MGKVIRDKQAQQALKKKCFDQKTKRINKNGLAMTYREFSRSKYHKYRHQFPRMRQSELVNKIIKQWQGFNERDHQALFKEYLIQNQLSDSQNSTPQEKPVTSNAVRVFIQEDWKQLIKLKDHLIQQIQRSLQGKESMSAIQRQSFIRSKMASQIKYKTGDDVTKYTNKKKYQEYQNNIISRFRGKFQSSKSSTRPFNPQQFQNVCEQVDSDFPRSNAPPQQKNDWIQLDLSEDDNEIPIGKVKNRRIRKELNWKKQNNFAIQIVTKFVDHIKQVLIPHKRYQEIDFDKFQKDSEYRMKFCVPSYYFIQNIDKSKRNTALTTRYMCCKCLKDFFADKYQAHFKKCMLQIYYCIIGLDCIAEQVSVYFHFKGPQNSLATTRDKQLLWAGDISRTHRRFLKKHIDIHGTNFHVIRYSRGKISFVDIKRPNSTQNNTQVISLNNSKQESIYEQNDGHDQSAKEDPIKPDSIQMEKLEKKDQAKQQSVKVHECTQQVLRFNHFSKKMETEIIYDILTYKMYFRPIGFTKNVWLQYQNINFFCLDLIIKELYKVRRELIENQSLENKKNLNHHLPMLKYIFYRPQYKMEGYRPDSIQGIRNWSSQFLGQLQKNESAPLGYRVNNLGSFVDPQIQDKDLLVRRYITKAIWKALQNHQFIEKVMVENFFHKFNGKSSKSFYALGAQKWQQLDAGDLQTSQYLENPMRGMK